MENNRLDELMTRRRDVVGLIQRANDCLKDIDEEIRMAGGSPEPDFSGAVERLRRRGVLPNPKK